VNKKQKKSYLEDLGVHYVRPLRREIRHDRRRPDADDRLPLDDEAGRDPSTNTPSSELRSAAVPAKQWRSLSLNFSFLLRRRKKEKKSIFWSSFARLASGCLLAVLDVVREREPVGVRDVHRREHVGIGVEVAAGDLVVDEDHGGAAGAAHGLALLHPRDGPSRAHHDLPLGLLRVQRPQQARLAAITHVVNKREKFLRSGEQHDLFLRVFLRAARSCGLSAIDDDVEAFPVQPPLREAPTLEHETIHGRNQELAVASGAHGGGAVQPERPGSACG